MIDVFFILLFLALVAVLGWVGWHDVIRAKRQATTTMFVAWCQYRSLDPDRETTTFPEFVEKIDSAAKCLRKFK